MNKKVLFRLMLWATYLTFHSEAHADKQANWEVLLGLGALFLLWDTVRQWKP